MPRHIREGKEIPIYVSQTFFFLVVQVLHLIEHSFYELHTYVLLLTSFSGEMVIYAFLVGFFLSFSSKRVL